MIARDEKRLKKIERAYKTRQTIKEKIKDQQLPMEEKIEYIKKLNKRPQNESIARKKTRCQKCGRARGYLRKFGLCRLCLRVAMMKGLVPGLKKASW